MRKRKVPDWYRPISDVLEYIRPCRPGEAGTKIDLAKCFGYLDDKTLSQVCRTLNEGLTRLRETKRQAKKMGLEVKTVD
jgi:hypothetical protein